MLPAWASAGDTPTVGTPSNAEYDEHGADAHEERTTARDTSVEC